jgi:hypothetical protein
MPCCCLDHQFMEELQMLTLSNPRSEASTTLLAHAGENRSLVYGLTLWAVAVVCIASWAPACATLAESASCVAMVGGGML